MAKLTDIDTGEAFGLGILFLITVWSIHGLCDAFIYPNIRRMAGMPPHGAAGSGSGTGGAAAGATS